MDTSQFSYSCVSWTISTSVRVKELHQDRTKYKTNFTRSTNHRTAISAAHCEHKSTIEKKVIYVSCDQLSNSKTQHNTPPNTGRTGTCQVMQEVIYQVTHDGICGQNHQHQASGDIQHVRRQRDGVSRRRPVIYEGRRISCVRLQGTLRTRRQAGRGKEGVHVDGEFCPL